MLLDCSSILPCCSTSLVALVAIATSALFVSHRFGPGMERAEDRASKPILASEEALRATYRHESIYLEVPSSGRQNHKVKIYTQYYYPRTSSPNGIVVYFHGINGHSGRLTDWYKRTLEHGWISGGIDFRGFGRSDGRHGYIEDFDHLVEDGLAFLKATKEKHPNQKLFVVGSSMGGLVLLHVVLKAPRGLIDGCVFHAPPVHISTAMRPSPALEQLGRWLCRYLPKLAVFRGHGVALSNSEPVHAHVNASKNADPLFYRGNLRIGTGLSMLCASTAIAEKLHLVELPHLLIHGTNDRICTIHGSETFFAKSPAKDKTFVRVPDGEHNIAEEVEHSREHFFETITTWLNEHRD